MNEKFQAVTLAAALVAVAVPSRAEAEERAPSRGERELETLDTLLGHFASESRGYRTWGGISALVIGAVSLPAGIVITGQNHESPAGPLTIGLGVGDLLAGTFLLAFPGGPNAQFQRLADLEHEKRAAGASADAVVDAVEEEWRKDAASSRAFRQVIGVVGVGVGALSLAGGAILAFGDFSSPSFTRPEQVALGAGLLGLGNAFVFLGLQVYFFEEPIETGWSTYRALTPSKLPRAALFQPHVQGLSFRPAPGGGVAAFTATY